MKKIIDREKTEALRRKAHEKGDTSIVIDQAGGQENMLASPADIVIGGGARGGAKSFSLLLYNLYYIGCPHFHGILFRKELATMSDLVDTSQQVLRQFGTYLKGEQTWRLNSGGTLTFGYHGDSLDAFRDRYQGRQFAYIGVDEITQMDYAKFKYLLTCNRNAYGLTNHFFGTCNPDPDSWVAKFIDWWIGDDGLPVRERDGKVRYCFMDGDSVEDILWGDSREEVYAQARPVIDRLWRPEYEAYGSPQKMFIQSAAFVSARLDDNHVLMRSDPSYVASLAGQSEAMRQRDLEGNWKFSDMGDDMISRSDMLTFFDNARQEGDGVRRASCDAAFDGGDNLVMWLWVGNHIDDVFVSRKDSRSAMQMVESRLVEWGVRQENLTYDMNGIGQAFKGFFPKAVGFNNRGSVDAKYKYIYDNLKSQAAYMLYDHLSRHELSIKPELLDRRYEGNGYGPTPLRQILLRERRAIRADESRADHGFSLIKKAVMKQMVGHSPDFIEAMLMWEVFAIRKTTRQIRGIGLV